MKWPDEFSIRLTADGAGMKGILIWVTLVAPKKSNVSLRPLLTDDQGDVVITRGMLEEALAGAHDNALMDYAGHLDDFRGTITIDMESLEQLRGRVRRIRRFYPDAASKLERLIATCANDRIRPAQVTREVAERVIVNVELM